MKPAILSLVLFFILNGIVLAKQSPNPAELIIGQWKADNNTIYEFKQDSKELFVNEEKYATYRFDDGILYLKYVASGDEFEADVQFEEDKMTMTLTEYMNIIKKEKILILRQVPR